MQQAQLEFSIEKISEEIKLPNDFIEKINDFLMENPKANATKTWKNVFPSMTKLDFIMTSDRNNLKFFITPKPIKIIKSISGVDEFKKSFTAYFNSIIKTNKMVILTRQGLPFALVKPIENDKISLKYCAKQNLNISDSRQVKTKFINRLRCDFVNFCCEDSNGNHIEFIALDTL